jgi:hypothetical protein
MEDLCWLEYASMTQLRKPQWQSDGKEQKCSTDKAKEHVEKFQGKFR